MRLHRRRFRAYGIRDSAQRGAAAVELAFVAPVIFALIMGIVDVGQFVNVSQTVSNASREAARLAARYRSESVSDVENAVSGYLGECFPSIAPETLDTAVQVNVRDGLGNVIPGGDLTTIPTGAAIDVEVVLSFNAVRWLGGVPLLNDQTLATTTTTRRE
jgi:Flp pilus assembly protein TadG